MPDRNGIPKVVILKYSAAWQAAVSGIPIALKIHPADKKNMQARPPPVRNTSVRMEPIQPCTFSPEPYICASKIRMPEESPRIMLWC